jgi:hypothetical protein
LVDLAGGNLHEGLEGKSYYGLLTDKENAPDTAIIEIMGSTALVTKDFKYGMYRQFREADLYDRNRDPEEFINIVNDPEYAEQVQRFTDYLYRMDPTLKEDFENTTSVNSLPVLLRLKNGESASRAGCPYLGGMAFTVKVDLEADKVADGPLVIHYEGPHGFSLFAEHGQLKAGFRKWNEDQLITLGKLNTGPNRIMFHLAQDGNLSVVLNNEEGFITKTSWPKPVQPGRKEYLTGVICAGHSGPAWAMPIGNYNRNSVFSGQINLMELEVSDDQN